MLLRNLELGVQDLEQDHGFHAEASQLVHLGFVELLDISTTKLNWRAYLRWRFMNFAGLTLS